LIILRFTGEGELFYFQRRLGFNNKEFYIWKFATMQKNSPNIGHGTITVPNDPRVTSIGKILRITKINELPQLINIIKGEMSFIGPRPLPLSDFSDYSEIVQKSIYLIKPGLTGIGSLVFRNEEKFFFGTNIDPKEFSQNVIAPYKGALEFWYYNNKSFWTDIKILFITFWSLFDANSNFVYKFFKDLPPKPFELTLEGIKSLK
jgi:lipopolysaccharide/colanic/teichoic acid biosynthesis glycosyltransferase